MSYTRNLFTGIGIDWTAGSYEAPPGALPGSNTMEASVMFMLQYGGPPGDMVPTDLNLWGNIDEVAFQGWALGITQAGLLTAKYGDGAAIVSVTFDPLGRLMGRWCVMSMIMSQNSVGFWVNGALVAVSAPGNALVPNSGNATLGSVLGSISGATYSDASILIPPDPYEQGTNVARTGQMGAPVVNIQNITYPDNAWQVPLYNDAEFAAAVWPAAVGDVDLTFVGTPGILKAQALPSNVWL